MPGRCAGTSTSSPRAAMTGHWETPPSSWSSSSRRRQCSRPPWRRTQRSWSTRWGGRTLYERLGTVAGHLDALGGALRRSVTAYNKAVGSMENRLLVTARSLETLGEQVSSPTPISADAAQVRTFTAPELTADRQTGLTEM